MALLAPSSSFERHSAPALSNNLVSDKFLAPLDGGVVKGTLVHQGSFRRIAALVPGYYGIELGYKPLAKLLAMLDNELAVATFEPIRQQLQKGRYASSFREPMIVPHRLLAETAAAVIEHVSTASNKTVETSSLIGHSTGGPGALNAAKLTHVDNIVLLASAGVTGHNLITLGARAPRVLWEGVRHRKRLVENLGSEQSADFFMGAVGDLARYVITNPPRTLGEGIAVGQCNVESSIPKVRNLGTRVSGLFFDHDGFFPGAKAEQHIGDKVDFFRSLGPDMGHLGPQTHTGEVALELTNQLAYLGQLGSRAAIA